MSVSTAPPAPQDTTPDPQPPFVATELGTLRRRPSLFRSESRAVRISAWVAVIVCGGFGLLPVYWLLATSLTPRA